MSNPPLTFTPEDVYLCPAYGKLWRVSRISGDGKWGLHRMRRGKKQGILVSDGAIVWRKPFAPFDEPVTVGKLIYSTGRNYVLIDLNSPVMSVNPD